jgi:hypothetical protein
VYFIYCALQVTVASNIWDGLTSVKVGSRVGLGLDSQRSLHVYLDGKDKGVMATDVPEPCYPFFELYGVLQKVGLLCNYSR